MASLMHYFKFIIFVLFYCFGWGATASAQVVFTTGTDTVIFSNNVNNLYEACVGDRVTFIHPFGSSINMFYYTSNSGLVKLTSAVTGGSPFSITIPDDAVSGPIEFRTGMNTRFTLPSLTIHNPTVDFVPLTSPLCATNDSILLYTIPKGGNFYVDGSSSHYINFNTTDSTYYMDATQAGWTNNHDSVMIDTVVYKHLPTYSDGAACPDSVVAQKVLSIYDNRLTQLAFAPLIKDANNPNLNDLILTLDSAQNNSSNVIIQLEPNIFHGVTAPYPYTFSGTYVNSSSVFLGNIAATTNPVTLEFNNNGCLGSITANLEVYEPLVIRDLPDTLCEEAAPVRFFRDPNPNIAYLDTAYNSLIPLGRFNRIENKVVGVQTDSAAHQMAIRAIDTIGGQEEFELNPALLPPGTQQVVIRMLYENRTSFNPFFIFPFAFTRIDTFQAIDTVIITPRPSLSFAGLRTAYCADGTVDTLQASPAFEYNPRTYFTLEGADSTGAFNLSANLIQERLFDPRAIYDTLVPNGNRNLLMRLTYTVNRYGCMNQISTTFDVRAALTPTFFAKGAYCLNEAPSLLQRNVLTSGVTESWLPAPGLDTSDGAFSPNLAGVGSVPITYILTDQFSCTYTFTDTLIVKAPPRIQMTLDGSRTNTIFCANPVDVDIRSTLLSGTIIDSIFYSGRGVIDSTFNPNSAFGGGGGSFSISAEATDTSGCKTYDTLRIQIIQAPSIDIDGTFNNQPSNYGANNSNRAEHTYCKSEGAFVIDGTPQYLDTLASTVRGIITGKGVQLLNNTYYYDPGQVNDTIEVDTVVYTYTDSIGCVNTETAIIKLDSVPIVSLNGFTNFSFCSNDANVQLQGIPDPTVSQGTYSYRGTGVNPNTGLFTPATAGTGAKSIIYQFIDSKGCVDADTIDIIVNAPTRAKFAGYKNQYCVSDRDTLYSLNDTSSGSFYFYGTIIIDSLGILSGNDSTLGFQDVFYVYIDSNNCVDTGSDNILINGTPNIEIYGLDSVYCYNDPVDIISVVPAGAGGGPTVGSDTAFSVTSGAIIFNPRLGTSGVKTLSYGYRDNTGCSSVLTIRTYVHAPPLPSVTNLNTFQCETQDTIPIFGSPYWGSFSGPGITANYSFPIDSIWGFIPSKAGVGTHTVVYSVDDTLTNYILGNGQSADSICAAEQILTINVRPLPNPRFIAPVNNTRFCSNDAPVVLQPDPNNPVWDNFRDTSSGISFTVDSVFVPRPGGGFNLIADTTYIFDPSAVTSGIHLITYIATDTISYCQDSVDITYIIDDYIPASFPLDSAYCASNDSILLNGTPAGGLFTRNDSILNPTRVSPFFYFDPTDTSVIFDTVTYTIQYGACADTVTKIVRINPLPQLSFTTTNAPHNIYCLGDDPVLLNTPNTGGSFDGSPGVLAGNHFFYPDLAGAGSHRVTLQYQEPSTGCSNTFSDTLYVYGRPNLDFAVTGGCQYDSIYFNPNNTILGLNNTNQNRVVDSITDVQWIFDANVMVAGSYRSNQVDSNIIDTIGHVYNTAGVYFPQLIVANREHCIDTQTVRLVISPSINSYPYAEDFENSSGEWFAESRDSSHSLLWNWGIDNNPQGIPDDASNHVWMTQTGAAYGGGEDAWVYSPCFDLDSLTRPMVSLDYWVDARPQFDGVVIEYQKEDGSWAPLGEVNRGIDWFNTSSIAGGPGDGSHRIFSLGWSGESNNWQNGRYKLDDYRGDDNKLRMRIAFASLTSTPQSFYDGFAFDNVIVRDRTRNVLLETMVHDKFTNMESINNQTYQLIHHTNLNKDVVLLQYHIENVSPQGGVNAPKDKFYLNNPSLGSTRSYEYGGPPAGRSFINGVDSNTTYTTEQLTAIDFEQDMLETPKFDITIDTFEHVNNNFKMVANVTALEPMPSANYRIYMVISEDSLSYDIGSSYLSEVHAVARENDQYHLNTTVGTNNLYNNRTWVTGENQRVELNWSHTGSGFINYQPDHFQAVVFIQNISTKEIFQVATTRDVSGYWVGIDPIAAVEELNEIQTVNLYPNPAHDYFNLEFDQALKHYYQWKLVDIRGVHVREGEIRAGNDQLRIDGLNYPSGTYILLLYNDKVFVQRKVVLGRP